MQNHISRLILLCVLITISTVLAQSPFKKDYLNNKSTANSDDEFYSIPKYTYKATRFIPVVSFDGLSEWSSPYTNYKIGGAEYNTFPFNYTSPDLVPYDIWNNQTNQNKFRFKSSADEGSINIVPERFEKSGFHFNGYFGSETGDPGIHVFTKKNERAINRNKIPFSGLFNFKGIPSEIIKYNFTAGYFSAYSTGSINDEMISSFGHYYFGKINKQFLGSANVDVSLGKNKSVLVDAGIISYYGWDVTPFLSSFTHFEVINSTIRTKVKNILNNLTLRVNRDQGVGKINLTSVNDPAEFFIIKYGVGSEYSFDPVKIWAGNLFFSLDANAEFINADDYDLNNEIKNQKFFSASVKQNNYTFGGKIIFNSGSLTSKTEFGYDDHYSGNRGVSLFQSFKKFLPENIGAVSINISSRIRIPNETELYGQYYFERNINQNKKRFLLKGNTELKNERVNRISIKYNTINIEQYFQAEIFYKIIENPIHQLPEEIIRHSFERDLLRNAVYKNGEIKRGIGAELLTEIPVARFLIFRAKYNYMQNDDALYTPKNKVDADVTVRLPFDALITFNWKFNSETVWEDFIVSAEDDYLKGKGYDGKVKSVNDFSILFDYTFNNFYMFKELNTGLRFTNIFNNETRYHPLGNRLDRAFIISISGRI